MTLLRLGFLAGELFDCHIWRDATLGVYAEIEGEQALCAIDTSLRLDLALDATYVLRRNLPVLRRNDAFGVCQLRAFQAFGRGRPHEAATFFGEPAPDSTSIFAGRIGAELLHDCILGLDPAGPAVGCSQRPELRASLPAPLERIPFIPQPESALPLTRALIDGHAPHARPAFLVASAGAGSYLCIDYVRENWRDGRLRRSAERALRRNRGIEVPIRLPSGRSICVPLRVHPDPPEYVVDVAAKRIDGVLGVDFLRRWLAVFDFPGRALLLFSLTTSRYGIREAEFCAAASQPLEQARLRVRRRTAAGRARSAGACDSKATRQPLWTTSLRKGSHSQEIANEAVPVISPTRCRPLPGSLDARLGIRRIPLPPHSHLIDDRLELSNDFIARRQLYLATQPLERFPVHPSFHVIGVGEADR
ncbi:MAG TPA: hypothetical protein VF188_13120 [Longimicrobiales bacterium]